jgi:hypothetical protein
MMPPLRPSLAVLAGLFLGLVPALAAPDWTKIKEGMKAEEAVKQLGEPLFRSSARGFEVWIYDGRGEVLFSGGPLKAWTVGAPTAESLARPVALDVLIRSVRRSRIRLAPIQALPVRTYQDESATHFRYQQP